METTVAYAPKILSGVDVIDEAWGGLYRGGSYLVYGRAATGRGLLTMMFVQTGTMLEERCLFISPDRPKDLMIQAASMGFNLRQAYEADLVKLMRIPPMLNLQEIGDDGVSKALNDLVSIIRQNRPDRLVINDFMPFVQFRSFERFRAAFVQMLEQIDSLDTTMMLVMAEPANQQSRKVIDFMRNQMTGAVHIELVEEDANSTKRRLTLIPNIGHIRRRVVEFWDLQQVVEEAEENVSSSLRMLPDASGSKIASEPKSHRRFRFGEAAPEAAPREETEWAPQSGRRMAEQHMEQEVEHHGFHSQEDQNTFVSRIERRTRERTWDEYEPREGSRADAWQQPSAVTPRRQSSFSPAEPGDPYGRFEPGGEVFQAADEPWQGATAPQERFQEEEPSIRPHRLGGARRSDPSHAAQEPATTEPQVRPIPLGRRPDVQPQQPSYRIPSEAERPSRPGPARRDEQPTYREPEQPSYRQDAQPAYRQPEQTVPPSHRPPEAPVNRQPPPAAPRQPEPSAYHEPEKAFYHEEPVYRDDPDRREEPGYRAPEAPRRPVEEPRRTAEPQTPPSPERPSHTDRDAFRTRLQQHFLRRDVNETPFLLVAMRMDRSQERTARPFDFEFILDLVSELLREQDDMFVELDRERLIVLLADSRPEAAQRFFAQLKNRLREEAPQQADHLLHSVSAIVVPDGRPFQNAEEFLTYALDEA